MTEKFRGLDEEKQQRIINAALAEFSQGYDRASTNEIVKNAGISKGLLFHYFGNKRNLFIYLYEYAVQTLLDNFWTKVDLSERDILLRWRRMSVLKLELTLKNPELFSFLVAVNFGGADEIVSELQQKNQQHIANFYTKFFADIDYSLFRADIDPRRAIEMMSWTIEGFANKLVAQVGKTPLHLADHAKLMQEVDEYLGLLRLIFYRQRAID